MKGWKKDWRKVWNFTVMDAFGADSLICRLGYTNRMGCRVAFFLWNPKVWKTGERYGKRHQRDSVHSEKMNIPPQAIRAQIQEQYDLSPEESKKYL